MQPSLFRSLTTLALALPVISIAAPHSVTVGDGDYALVAGWRFQGVEMSEIGQQEAPWTLFTFNQKDYDAWTLLGGSWLGGPSAEPFSFPGQGAIIGVSGGSDTFLFQQKTPPHLPLNLKAGLNLVCCQSDITAASYEDIVGTPPVDDTLLYQFNPGEGRSPFHLGAPDYNIFMYKSAVWTPSVPVIGVTEAVFILHPQQLINFQMTANGAVSFELTTPVDKQVTIEYSESLTQSSWQTLTNFVGTGASVQIKDQPSGNRRFYRSRMSE